MRLRDDAPKTKSGVRDIWEIRLDKTIKARLRALARRRRCTMSWLARYCIFRLVHKKIIHMEEFHAMVDEIKATRPSFRELDRFYVCFYGNDILWIKMQASTLGVTVSMLVRVALLRYLGTLESERAVPWWRLFWYGIKINKHITCTRQRRYGVIVQEFLNSKSFGRDDYWEIPPAQLPIFLTDPIANPCSS